MDEALAWAAGMFEGEGSIRINIATKRSTGSLMVDMVNTDPEVIAFYQTRWPGHMRWVAGSGNRRDFYRWRIAATVAARFLNDIMPYLRTHRVREKALLALDYQAQKSKLSTVNRSPEYGERQLWFYDRMAALNRRGRA